MPKLNYNKFCS